MSNICLNHGIYLVEKEVRKNGVPATHFGLLDVGNNFGLSQYKGFEPIVVHQTPPQIRVDSLSSTGSWTVVERISDVVGAVERLRLALNSPFYNLLLNNCEHFARFVAQGSKVSNQVFWYITGLIILAGGATYVIKNR